MSDAKDVERIARLFHPMLGGHPAEVQGAVLAALLATWLGGHIIPGNPAETDAIRERLLEAHIDFVRKLIPLNADEEP